MKLRLDWGNWLYGLFVGGISGGASAVYGGFGASIIDSKNFAFGSVASFKFMGMMFAVMFLKDAALFLSQHPLPSKITETSTETMEQAGRPSMVRTIEKVTVVEENKGGETK